MIIGKNVLLFVKDSCFFIMIELFLKLHAHLILSVYQTHIIVGNTTQKKLFCH